MAMVSSNVAKQVISLEDYLANPPAGVEWVNGQLIEKHPIKWDNGEIVGKPGMTARTRRIQSKLDYYWRSYMISSSQGGEVYVEVTCRTHKQGRMPDVAYITPDLLAQVGEFTSLPQSFPLIAEVISPTDLADEVFAKAQEYLQSGCQEVWLLFPESRWILVITLNQVCLFKSGEVASTQVVLPGFSVAVDELMA